MGIISRIASAVTGNSNSSSDSSSAQSSSSSDASPTTQQTSAHLADLPGQADAEKAAEGQFKGSRFNNGHRRI